LSGYSNTPFFAEGENGVATDAGESCHADSSCGFFFAKASQKKVQPDICRVAAGANPLTCTKYQLAPGRFTLADRLVDQGTF
jgi:hypothetical protein